IVEMPPGPPVQSPIVAEVYGLDYSAHRRIAQRLAQVFRETPDIVDVDTSVEARQPKAILAVDRAKAALFGIPQGQVVEAIQAALQGLDASYVHRGYRKYPLPIRLQLPQDARSSLDALLALRLKAGSGALVPLSELVEVEEGTRDFAIYHKDLLPVTFVTADMAGKIDSPLYGMAELVSRLEGSPIEGASLRQFFIRPPDNPYRYSLKWDGEWQVTYETFRDMGIAYGVGLVLIYLLVVGQFRSYLVPLVIMAPIPLTLIGVMPGHALLGAKFTATSMIGMIALAGIIVRNSILLVDFINQHVKGGMPLEEAVVRSGSVRAKPIALTGLAAMLGAFFILDDPIFSGLAISLIFGIFASTLLTLVVIPVMYYAFRYKRMGT
ncbi:MAG: efflux RND transporter permease subunit, partial [Gammaproteobacteria bacterium]